MQKVRLVVEINSDKFDDWTPEELVGHIGTMFTMRMVADPDLDYNMCIKVDDNRSKSAMWDYHSQGCQCGIPPEHLDLPKAKEQPAQAPPPAAQAAEKSAPAKPKPAPAQTGPSTAIPEKPKVDSSKKKDVEKAPVEQEPVEQTLFKWAQQ